MTAIEQLGLLDDHGRIHAIPHSTEVDAAMNVDAKALRARVLCILQNNPNGLTDDEGGKLLGGDRLDFGRRRSELYRAGLVIKTGERRASDRGNPANVWRAAS